MPINPMLMRRLGAFWRNTVEGTMVGSAGAAPESGWGFLRNSTACERMMFHSRQGCESGTGESRLSNPQIIALCRAGPAPRARDGAGREAGERTDSHQFAETIGRFPSPGLSATLLYLNFHLSLSGTDPMENGIALLPAGGRTVARRRSATLWHWPLAKCAGSQSRSCRCPKLEPFIERPTKANSYWQE